MTAVVVLLAVWFLARMGLAELWTTLRSARWGLVLVAAAVNLLLNIPARTFRFRTLLTPLPRSTSGAGFGELLSLLLASHAVSNLVPARAGDALRVAALQRRHGYPVGALLAALLLEKIIESLSMALFALPLLLFGQPTPGLKHALYVMAGLGLLGLLAVGVLAQKTPPAPGGGGPVSTLVRSVLARLVEALRLLHAPAVWLRGLGWATVSDVLDVGMVGLCLAAVGVHLPVPAWFAVFLAINLAIVVPATPGNMGLLEAGAVLALEALGVPAHKGLAFALLYHAAHVLLPTAAGLVTLRRSWR